MIITRPPALYPGDFLMKNIKSTPNTCNNNIYTVYTVISRSVNFADFTVSLPSAKYSSLKRSCGLRKQCIIQLDYISINKPQKSFHTCLPRNLKITTYAVCATCNSVTAAEVIISFIPS